MRPSCLGLSQNVARARLPLVVGVSAPTQLAVTLAQCLRMTLIGFLRSDRLAVYPQGARIRYLLHDN